MSEPHAKHTSGNHIVLACRCGSEERVPAFYDKGTLKPVTPYPRICLGCWLDGWRSRGPLTDGQWEVYHDPAQCYKPVRL